MINRFKSKQKILLVILTLLLLITAGCDADTAELLQGSGLTGSVAETVETQAPAETAPEEPEQEPPLLEAAENDFTVHFIDVGQADCIFIQYQDKNLLIDAGNRGDASDITAYLRSLGVEQIQYMILTHPHEDHIGSAAALIDIFSVTETLYMPDVSYSSTVYDKLLETVMAADIDVIDAEAGDDVYLGDCEVLFTAPNDYYKDVNNMSAVVKVTHGNMRFLFTGDAEAMSERDMIEAGFDLEADLLKVGHHGSENASSYVFLREVNPRYSVIMCGTGNSYGHPNDAALSRLFDVGSEVYRTDTMGTIVAVSDGLDITFNQSGIPSEREHIEDQDGLVDPGQEIIVSTLIGNSSSKKFHDPGCSSLPGEDNRVTFETREEALEAGYESCKRCNP